MSTHQHLPAFILERLQAKRRQGLLLTIYILLAVCALYIASYLPNLEFSRIGISVIVIGYLMPTLITWAATFESKDERIGVVYIFVIFTTNGLLRLVCDPSYMVDFFYLPTFVAMAYISLPERFAFYLSIYQASLMAICTWISFKYSPLPILYKNELLPSSIWIAAIVSYLASHIYHRFYISRSRLLLEEVRMLHQEVSVQKDDYRMLMTTLLHDLANPLTVSNFALSQSDQHPEKMVQIARQQTELCISVVENLRALNKVMEKGNFPIRETSIKCVWEAIQKNFEEVSQHKGLTLYFDSTNNALNLAIDPISFHVHIMANLVSNALKFASHGSVIRFSTEDSHETIIINIENTGPELGQDLFISLLSIESQMQSTPNQNGERGQGLGLLIVKKFCRKMNIRITGKYQKLTNGQVITTLSLRVPKLVSFENDDKSFSDAKKKNCPAIV